MDLGISGKVAVVGGGSRGCGLAISAALAREGARVVLTGRQAAIVAAAVAGIRAAGGEAHGVVADLTRKPDAARIAAEARRVFGDPAILVVNPAWSDRTRGFAQTTDEQFQRGNDIWIMSVVYLLRELLPAMQAAKWGRVVVMGSIAMKEPHVEDPMYLGNTRVAAAALIKTLAHEYGRQGITANTIATGPFLTELSRSYMQDEGAYTEDAMMSLTAMGRWGRPEEMGDVVAFLCSERASYVSGETIRVDGGYGHSLF
ncbi:MAG TPA: SDR family oxidoreductase [Acetobacteraceae bacterium]|nr:SDR family oxidoreductase [Acetobacteraceae bacterium]